MEDIFSVMVRLEAFEGNNPKVRIVDIPWSEWAGYGLVHKLEKVFYYGQNDFQPKPIRSVSVGDVILLDGEEYRVDPFGFSRRVWQEL